MPTGTGDDHSTVTISAHTIGCKAVEILSSTADHEAVGSVHSIFPSALNILGPSGLIAVIGKSFRHPAAVNVTATSHDFPGKISVGMKVKKVSRGFSILKPGGGTAMTFDTGNARNYDGGTTPASRKQLNNLVRSQIFMHFDRWKSLGDVGRAYRLWGRRSELGDLIPAVCSPSPEAAIDKSTHSAWALVTHLMKSLERNDENEIDRAVFSLLGRGPGLTPSGDDLLGGLLSTWVLVGRSLGISDDRVAALAGIVSNSSKARTTTVSRCLLDYAGQGLVGEPFYLLICALALAMRDAWARARSALRYGGTSGGDTVLGICIAFRLAPAWGFSPLQTGMLE